MYLIHLKLLHLFVQASVEQVDEVEELEAENIHGGPLMSPTPKSLLKFKYCYHIWVIKAVAIVNMAIFIISIITISMITMTTTILIINKSSPL